MGVPGLPRIDRTPAGHVADPLLLVRVEPVTEVRDHLDDRFRLLVGSRRGIERHQTLRHAVQWSFDLLDDAEKSVLARCSVFAGGFDLAAARAVAGSNDEFATLDLLDALERKSLLVADRSTERTRFSMLETIRQSAEEQLARTGEADATRTEHAHHFAGREADILALWDSPRQRETYTWFIAELANLRTAFPWAADQGDLDVAAALASGFHPLSVTVHAATGHRHDAIVAFDGDTAIVEVANTCGLSTLPGGVLAP